MVRCLNLEPSWNGFRLMDDMITLPHLLEYFTLLPCPTPALNLRANVSIKVSKESWYSSKIYFSPTHLQYFLICSIVKYIRIPVEIPIFLLPSTRVYFFLFHPKKSSQYVLESYHPSLSYISSSSTSRSWIMPNNLPRDPHFRCTWDHSSRRLWLCRHSRQSHLERPSWLHCRGNKPSRRRWW